MFIKGDTGHWAVCANCGVHRRYHRYCPDSVVATPQLAKDLERLRAESARTAAKLTAYEADTQSRAAWREKLEAEARAKALEEAARVAAQMCGDVHHHDNCESQVSRYGCGIARAIRALAEPKESKP